MTTTITGVTSVTTSGSNYYVDPQAELILEDAPGGTATFSVTSITVAASGGLIVDSHTEAAQVTLAGNETINVGGQGSITTITNGGSQVVYGSASYTQISAGGTQTLASSTSGSYSYDTLVDGGGAQIVDANALSEDSTVFAAGIMSVTSGGVVANALMSGGIISVGAGATASSTFISSGGRQLVSGTAIYTTISSGGHEYVYGGSSTDAFISAGGTQLVQYGYADNNYNTGTTISATLSGRVRGAPPGSPNAATPQRRAWAMAAPPQTR
jgi:autotransporter passenger strand-loop-strand repeat protein